MREYVLRPADEAEDALARAILDVWDGPGFSEADHDGKATMLIKAIAEFRDAYVPF